MKRYDYKEIVNQLMIYNKEIWKYTVIFRPSEIHTSYQRKSDTFSSFIILFHKVFVCW